MRLYGSTQVLKSSSCQLSPCITAQSFNSGSSSSLTNYCVRNEKKMDPSQEKWVCDASLMMPFLSSGGSSQGSGGTGEHHPPAFLSCASPGRSDIPTLGWAERTVYGHHLSYSDCAVWAAWINASVLWEVCTGWSKAIKNIILSLACAHAGTLSLYTKGCLERRLWDGVNIFCAC